MLNRRLTLIREKSLSSIQRSVDSQNILHSDADSIKEESEERESLSFNPAAGPTHIGEMTIKEDYRDLQS